MEFEKYSGTGNDFIVIDNRTGHCDKVGKDEWAKLCKRGLSVGADGVLLLEESEKTDFKMVYLNADGGEVGMCGNGARCIVHFYWKKTEKEKAKFSFETRDGVYQGEVVSEDYVDVQMTEIFDEQKVHLDNLVECESSFYINTGVPHSVFYMSDVDSIDICKMGSKVRFDDRFKNGANANFCEEVSAGKIKMRTYERGVENETLACGTGAVAAAIGYRKNFKKEDEVLVMMPGGDLTIKFKDDEIYLCGKVENIYSGKIVQK